MTSQLEILSLLDPFAEPNPSTRTVAEVARSAESHGVDRVLIGYGSATADGWSIAAHAVAATTSLHVLVAHRPGVMHPVAAARMAATQQYFAEGRFAFNIVSGGSPGDQLREGDDLRKDLRYARATEYLEIMRTVWAAREPVTFEGEFYRLERAFLAVPPTHPVPIYMGGASGGALTFGVANADTYMLWGEPLVSTAERIAEIEGEAERLGRTRPRICVSLRLVLGPTNEVAWKRAQLLLAGFGEARSRAKTHVDDVGRQRQLEIARSAERHDTTFWSGITALTGGMGNTSALVGTADEILDALREYRALGIDSFLLTGEHGRWSEELAPVIGRIRDELG